jgi:uncharacterized membrane protein (DUF2068 family)
MTALGAWVRWEFGRRIEINGVIVYIICERLVKAVILIGGGITLLVVAAHTDLHNLAVEAQSDLNLDAGTSLWRRLFDQLLARFGSHANPIAVGAILYGCLEVVEAVGLMLRRRWAEYLVLAATVAFLPLEIDEMLRRPTALKALTLLVNLAIAAYLIWRKQLFLARDRSTADAA